MTWTKEKWMIIQKTKTLRDYVYDDHPAEAHRLAQEIIMDLEAHGTQKEGNKPRVLGGVDRNGAAKDK